VKPESAGFLRKSRRFLEKAQALPDVNHWPDEAGNDLVEDAMAGYFDEVLQTRETLDGRYDDLKSGRVKPINGEKAFARLKAKTEAECNRQA
jgi:hypothetical protein